MFYGSLLGTLKQKYTIDPQKEKVIKSIPHRKPSITEEGKRGRQMEVKTVRWH